jgi:MFS family permease
MLDRRVTKASSVAGLIGMPAFRVLWVADTVGFTASMVNLVTLPSAAIILLHATPGEVAALGIIQFLPFPLVGFFAGVVVDRMPKRPLMVSSNVIRFLVLLSVSLAFGAGHISLGLLYVASFLTGLFRVIYDAANQAFVPGLVKPTGLATANSTLQSGNGVALAVTPPLAGLLIAALGPAQAIAADALLFLPAGVTLLFLPSRFELPPARPKSFYSELRAGFEVLMRNGPMRRILVATCIFNFGVGVAEPLFIVFAYRGLHLSPAQVGLTFGLGNLGFLLGALAAPWLTGRFGLGRVFLVATVLIGISEASTPLSSFGPTSLTLGLIRMFLSLWVTVFNVTALSYRQSVLDAHMQGRVNAGFSATTWGVVPLGMALGGALSQTVGLPATFIAGGIMSLAAVLVLASASMMAIRYAEVRT